MKKLATLGVALLVAFLGYYQQRNAGVRPEENQNNLAEQTQHAQGAEDTAVEQAIAERRSDVQLTILGSVKKVLSDDSEGSRHQRFIVELPSGHTILVAHNIDLAERIPNLQAGDAIELYGEYVWNDRGGVMHWTHRDPAGRHAAGWIKHSGHLYQ